MFERKSFNNHYEGAIEPFKIIGNTYFVGTFPASSHLIDTGDGLILLDTGYAEWFDFDRHRLQRHFVFTCKFHLQIRLFAI